MSLQKPKRKVLKQEAQEMPQNKINQHKGEKSENTGFLNKVMP